LAITDEKRQQQNEEDFNAVRKLLAGDKSAFEFIQKKYKPILRSLIRKRIDNEDDIEDMMQETFIKVYNAIDSFKFEYSFYSWINRIASNHCIDFLRKKRFNMISLDQPLGNDDDENYLELGDDSYIPEKYILGDERTELLLEAINQLPDNYKEIIRLRHEEELDYKEIADKLDIPLGTVKAHLFRARKLLYEYLKKFRHVFENE